MKDKIVILRGPGCKIKLGNKEVELLGNGAMTFVDNETLVELKKNKDFKIWAEKGYVTTSDAAQGVTSTNDASSDEAFKKQVKAELWQKIKEESIANLKSQNPEMSAQELNKLVKDALSGISITDEDVDAEIVKRNAK